MALPRMLNTTLWVNLLLACLVFMPFLIFMDRTDLFEFMNLLLVAVAAGTAVGFHPAAVNALKLPAHEVTSGQILVVGLVLASVSVILIFTGQWIWRAYDKPDWISDNGLLAFGRWLLLVSWVLTLLASGSDQGRLPVSTYKRAGIIVFFTVALAAVILTFFDLGQPRSLHYRRP